MEPIPPDTELIEWALALHEALGAMSPSDDFPASAIESLSDVLTQVIAELRGERDLHITRFRPGGLTSYQRNNYEGTLATEEGGDMYDFVRTLAYRAEALDLPPVVPVNEV
jgi:hypothetical protein